ncbi:hypothetical protein PkP19E3_33105 (plasmid) [Pseudomonas koreensis]|nr:hypothetical protein PkP19E3_33105 [Pseudomonas koreensis]
MSAKRGIMMFVPNKYAPVERIVLLVIGVSLAWWGFGGYVTGELYLPGRKDGIYLRDGLSLILGVVGMLSGAVACFAGIVDHYDERDNEQKYATFFKRCKFAAIVCLTSAVALQLRS